jgi:hypothetical protein
MQICLSDIMEHDAIINHSIELSSIQNTFCYHLCGNEPTIDNINNNKIKLFTFSENIFPKTFRISKLKIKKKYIGLKKYILHTYSTISQDFIESLSVYEKQNSLNNNDIHNTPLEIENIQKSNVQRYKNLKKYINHHCLDNMHNNHFLHLKTNSKLFSKNNKKYNITCFKLFKQIITFYPNRIQNIKKNIQSLPFRKKDIIYFFITLSYKDYKKTYRINLILV